MTSILLWDRFSEQGCELSTELRGSPASLLQSFCSGAMVLQQLPQALELRIRLYTCLVTRRLLSKAEARPLSKADKHISTEDTATEKLVLDIEEVAALIKANKEMSDGTIKEEKGMCDCAPGGGWRLGLGEIMTGEIVNNISTGFVVFNLVIMCMPYY